MPKAIAAATANFAPTGKELITHGEARLLESKSAASREEAIKDQAYLLSVRDWLNSLGLYPVLQDLRPKAQAYVLKIRRDRTREVRIDESLCNAVEQLLRHDYRGEREGPLQSHRAAVEKMFEAHPRLKEHYESVAEDALPALKRRLLQAGKAFRL